MRRKIKIPKRKVLHGEYFLSSKNTDSLTIIDKHNVVNTLIIDESVKRIDSYIGNCLKNIVLMKDFPNITVESFVNNLDNFYNLIEIVAHSSLFIGEDAFKNPIESFILKSRFNVENNFSEIKVNYFSNDVNDIMCFNDDIDIFVKMKRDTHEILSSTVSIKNSKYIYDKNDIFTITSKYNKIQYLCPIKDNIKIIDFTNLDDKTERIEFNYDDDLKNVNKIILPKRDNDLSIYFKSSNIKSIEIFDKNINCLDGSIKKLGCNDYIIRQIHNFDGHYVFIALYKNTEDETIIYTKDDNIFRYSGIYNTKDDILKKIEREQELENFFKLVDEKKLTIDDLKCIKYIVERYNTNFIKDNLQKRLEMR